MNTITIEWKHNTEIIYTKNLVINQKLWYQSGNDSESFLQLHHIPLTYLKPRNGRRVKNCHSTRPTGHNGAIVATVQTVKLQPTAHWNRDQHPYPLHLREINKLELHKMVQAYDLAISGRDHLNHIIDDPPFTNDPAYNQWIKRDSIVIS